MNIYEERRKYFDDFVNSYKCYDDYILFAKLMHRIIQYFEGLENIQDIPYTQNIRANDHRKIEITYKSLPTDSIAGTEIVALYYDEKLHEVSTVNPFVGVITYGPDGGVELCSNRDSWGINDILIPIEDVPNILDEDVFFQYSVIHKNLDMLSFVMHSYLTSVNCPSFFFDPDLFHEVLTNSGIDISDYLPRNV